MSVPPLPPEPPDRRKSDRIAATIIALTMMIGVTVLALTDRVGSEAALAAYVTAAAIAGFPIVVKRNDGNGK